MKKSRIIILSGIAVVVIAVGVGLSMYFKPHKTFAGAEPDFQLTAAELIDAFSTDEAAATEKYVADDKVILVTGVVRSIDMQGGGSVVIVLDREGGNGSVACTLTPEESVKSGSVTKGSTVSITGQCTGMQGLIEPEVIMIRCGLVPD